MARDMPITPSEHPIGTPMSRRVLVRMSLEFLADLCRASEPETWSDAWRVETGVPATARLVSQLIDVAGGYLVLYFEDETFEPVHTGGLIPEVRPMLCTRR